MPKKLFEIASEIVQTQVSLDPMTAADIALSLREIFNTLQEIQKAEATGNALALAPLFPETPLEEATESKLTPEDSIQNDKVICLECGAEFRQITQKHLGSHGMNQREYKKKYGFTLKTPLSARSVTKARIKAAKKRGLPEKLQQYIEARRQEKAKAPNKAEKSMAAGKPTRTILRKKK